MYCIVCVLRLSRRSQPPLFTQMNADYYNATNNKTFLYEMLPLMEQELTWWRDHRTIDIEPYPNERYIMFQYRVTLISNYCNCYRK